MPNLIFVLMVNREQLEKAINGVYGPVDAHAYLGKFVHLFFSLPKKSTFSTGNDYNWRYCFTLAEKYKLNNESKKPFNDFVQDFSKIAHAMSLSFRDIEKAIALLAFANARDDKIYFAWPIALKLKKPYLLSRLVRNEMPAHQEAQQYMQALFKQDNDSRFYCYGLFQALHKGHASGFDTLTDTEKAEFQSTGRVRNPHEFLHYLLSRIDIKID